MYRQVITPRLQPAVSVPEQCLFSHIDVPGQYTADSPPVISDDWALIESFIDAASDQVETFADTALLAEQIMETYDFFPGTQDPRNMLGFYQLGYAYNAPPWWWFGFPSMDSIELTMRPVITGGSPPLDPVITYNDPNGVNQVWDSSHYTVAYNKITLNVGDTWPLTDRKQDCIQIAYWAGYDPAVVPSRLKLANKYLGGWFYENRVHAGVEKTQEVIDTLSSLLSSYRNLRIPR